MTITSALLLVAVGAILRWAVNAHSSWIDLRTTGLILFVIGLVGLAISIYYAFWGWGAPRSRSASAATPSSTRTS
jgi:hypothetical protein